jgi:hypothetical protein
MGKLNYGKHQNRYPDEKEAQEKRRVINLFAPVVSLWDPELYWKEISY